MGAPLSDRSPLQASAVTVHAINCARDPCLTSKHMYGTRTNTLQATFEILLTTLDVIVTETIFKLKVEI
uniref:Uncharacterized protein n=1 Tax=Setaria viridis TaxID=4556 RepID=A0A4U6U708_SETVI|nr:hypothetical protein SEVIR_6G107966v2 [Setaria viridis]